MKEENPVGEDSVCGMSSKFQTAKTLLISEASASTTAGALSLLVDGLDSTQNTTAAHDTSVRNDTGIILPSQFSSTIVGGRNEVDLDDDLCSTPGDLVIPPSRLLITSTQVSDPKSSNLPSSESSDKKDSASALTINSSSKETPFWNVSQVPHSANDATANPPKRRKSFFLPSSEANSSHIQSDGEPKEESSSTADHEVYEFQYIDPKSKVHVSPLKELLETEIRSKANSSSVQSDIRETESHSKRNLGQEIVNGGSKVGASASTSLERSSSPQMFDSDEDLFANTSPGKSKQNEEKNEKPNVLKKSSNVRLAPIFSSYSAYQRKRVTPPKEQLPKSTEKSKKLEGKSVKPSKGCGKANCGKENSGKAFHPNHIDKTFKNS